MTIFWRLGVLAALLLPAPAFAQQDAGSELRALQAEMDQDRAALETSDCTTACRALDSMRRAADRICAIDPGDSCARAQARVRESAERVRAACPTCARETKEKDEGEAKVPPAAPAPPAAGEQAVQAEAPQKRGGCAGCAVSDGAEGGAVALGIAAAAAVVAGARRRKNRPGARRLK